MSRCKLFLLALLILGSGGSLLATFIVSGDCWYTTYDEKGVGQRRTTKAFTITVDGCRWRIRTAQSGANGSGWGTSACLYMEAANSVDSLFVTRVYDTSKREPSNPPIMPRSVTVTSGKTPCVDPDQFTAAIWFPYLSNCELKTATNGRVKYFFAMNDSMVRDDITFPFTARSVSNSSPPLLQELLLHNEGFESIPKIDGTLEKRPLKPPFTNGYTQISFCVLDFTNVAKLSLPRHSQIKYFRPASGATTNSEILPRGQIDILAQSITITNASLPPPEWVAPPTIIYDKRLPPMGDEDFWYFSKGFIYETNSPEVMRVLQQYEDRQDQIRKNTERLP